MSVNLFPDFEQDSNSLSIDANGDGIADQNDVDGDGISDNQIIDRDWFEISTDDDIEIEDLPEIDFPEIETTETAIVEGISDLGDWDLQHLDDTCSIVAQEYILDEIGQAYGIDFSEDELLEIATTNGWYTPDGGTPALYMGSLLEAHGIGVEKTVNASLEDINWQLQAGNKVLVAVDSDEIWNPDGIDEDDLIANLQGMPGQKPNHTVQVVGIDNSDPNNPMIILNDPGIRDGKGLTVPADNFLDAWEDSNNFMIATTGRNVDPNQMEFAFENESSYMNNIRLGSISEGDNHTFWGDSYQTDADNKSFWANSYASAGNTDKALEYSRSAAVAQEKADELYDNAMDEYSST